MQEKKKSKVNGV